ncbi:hypothetical protein JVX90_12545 [Gordonia sp. PDNC005]|uniref:hypothetical protein n=1 Tax=unclassified Gordonia (in: high G+C Gram-positive bacteria) TaxID=2657482 RepID=UPI00196403EB|nr:hypothetical protein [Gordonia sp. PDNC005]QRY61261.1 hypothetical protein JVX90_12545 [Gordonia sp. PDNC005]
MNRIIRGITVGAVALGAVALAPAPAQAAPVVPFQIQPAPFGNPNGSLDVPPIRCGLVRDSVGVVTVTGTRRDRWGCIPRASVSWINLSTGRTGSARLSAGLNGHVPQARLVTGRGQVVLTLGSAGGVMTPGFATIAA